jgi:molecular chaperone GrpE
MTSKSEKEAEKKENEGQEIEIEYLTSGKKKPIKKHALSSEKTKELKDKLEKREEEVKELNKELDDIKNEYLRLAADKENLRKRLEREKNEFFQYALSETLKDILIVLDNFERALSSEAQTNKAGFREGIEMIYKQLLDITKKHGVTPIEVEDNRFDPRLQQAFITEESDEIEEPQVSEELQLGYMLHDRLLRPALVKVLVPKKEK